MYSNRTQAKARDHVQSTRFQEPGKFLPNSKNPCWYGDPKHKRQLLCLPYFYVAGVAKCGTTDLYKRIRYHPEIMEGVLKEYHWWDRLRYGASMELKYTKDSEKNESELFDHTPTIVFRHLSLKEGCRNPVLGVCCLVSFSWERFSSENKQLPYNRKL